MLLIEFFTSKILKKMLWKIELSVNWMSWIWNSLIKLFWPIKALNSGKERNVLFSCGWGWRYVLGECHLLYLFSLWKNVVSQSTFNSKMSLLSSIAITFCLKQMVMLSLILSLSPAYIRSSVPVTRRWIALP